MPSDEIQLLRDYAATRSQPAFAQLAQRYVDLVYSAARRQCRGDAHLAEDVTQAVFIILAEKAASVPADRPLSAWLLKTTGYCAANARRSKTHREHYERSAAQMARMNELSAAEESGAWDELAPMLDEGMNKLRPQDRDALLLKFFEKKSMRQIGDALGISEEAAGKRCARAVERLRDFFRRRGVAVSAAALPVLLMTNAAQAAPAAVVSAVVAGAGAAAVAATTTATTSGTGAAAASVAKGALAVMAVEKAKAVALAAAAIILGVGASAVVVQTMIAPVSRGNRQVTVAAQPVVAQDATAGRPLDANHVWPIRFPDGTVVEVLGLCEPNAADDAARDGWWAPDGTRIMPPAARGNTRVVSIPAARGARTIRVLLRFPALAPDTSRAVSLRPNIGGGTTHTSSVNVAANGNAAGGGVTQYLTNVPADQATADLMIGLSSGPWETVATYDATTLQSSLPGNSPVLTSIAEEPGAIVVHATVPPGPAAAAIAAPERRTRVEQLVAVTDAGEVRADSVRFVNNRTEARFPVARSNVRRFEWRARAIVYVQAHDVSLRPAVPTTVRVSAVESPTSTSAAAR
jgi:RNA polymerase sigma factor (sigma-70 family)